MEVANALVMGERRGRITPMDADRFLTILGTFPIGVDDETAARAWTDLLHIPRVHKLSVYDAFYLELAIRRGLPLASLDARLQNAATAVGVPLYGAA